MSSETSSIIKGSCFCKRVQYEVASGTAQWIRCHCSMCKKLVGADFATVFAVKESKLTLKSEDSLKSFRSSEDVARSFCSNCGCSVFMNSDTEKNTIWINAGTLDNEIPVTRPTQIFVENKAFWLDAVGNSDGSSGMSNWELDCAKDL